MSKKAILILETDAVAKAIEAEMDALIQKDADFHEQLQKDRDAAWDKLIVHLKNLKLIPDTVTYGDDTDIHVENGAVFFDPTPKKKLTKEFEITGGKAEALAKILGGLFDNRNKSNGDGSKEAHVH